MVAALNEQAVEQSERNEGVALNEQVDPSEGALLNEQVGPVALVAQADLVVSELQVAPNKPVGLEAEQQVVPDVPVGLVVEQNQVLAGNQFDLKQNHKVVLADMQR